MSAKRTAIGLFTPLLVSQMLLAGTANAEKMYQFEGDKLQPPKGYREWIFIGTPLTPNDMNNGHAAFPEFHNVYLDPVSWKQWKEKGTVPDGAVMVKEMVSVGTKLAPSGKGYFEGEYIGLEVSVKDTARFPEAPGGWTYYSFTDPGKPVKPYAVAQPAAACNACHSALADDDFMFTQYYPVLRAGKAKGDLATGVNGS